MKKRKKDISRNIGLEIGSICSQHLLGLEHLHYGYWDNGLEPVLANMGRAQAAYADFLVSNVPQGVESLLDVGCGTGKMAQKLTAAGYHVDCVSPSSFLAERARAIIGNGSEIFVCPFEQLDTTKKYDLVMFSESFQYIDLETALKKSLEFLKPTGAILICDFFKNPPRNSPISGGHFLSKFYDRLELFPLKIEKDIDITERTSPTIDVEDKVFREVGEPVLALTEDFFESRYKLISRFLKWKYRKKIEKIRDKYFSGKRNSEAFKHYKTYRLFILRREASGGQQFGEISGM